MSCTVGDCLISRPKGRSRPRELWFSIYSCSISGETNQITVVHVTDHMTMVEAIRWLGQMAVVIADQMAHVHATK